MSVTSLEIIVGTYEEFLLGYRVTKTEIKKYKLVQSFANHSHRASIRCVTTCGKLLASGGADETIYLYDLHTRKETGMLMHHNGTVHCLEFTPNGSHLLSGSEDGNLAVCRTGNWQLEKVWGAAHKGSAVTSMSVHPTGKLLLSLGTDGTLRTWNLIKGRKAYVTNLGKESRWSSGVIWSPDGTHYIVLPGGKRADVYSVETAGIKCSLKLQWGVCCACFLTPDTFSLAGEGGNIALYSLNEKSGEPTKQVKAHEDRVKATGAITLADGSTWLASASSGGQIKLWQFKDGKLKEKCCADAGCRITCLALVLLDPSFEDVKEPEVDIKPESNSDTEPEFIVTGTSSKHTPEIGEVIVEVDRTTRKRKRRKSKKKNSVGEGADIECVENGNKSMENQNVKQERTKKKMKELTSSGGQWSVQDI
ncbi:p21-activated protein kinase-interacting protein 1-like [Schistocerca nitens]|uniref:p21-activated protein kinase-interacting protein 1-like n=1 Tax=Schistocerca nitens TaxID=7011 RepID=UPI0021197055|nr:p21-activated protein kinase-interacting protein 1-like [Schistocerca nitens]